MVNGANSFFQLVKTVKNHLLSNFNKETKPQELSAATAIIRKLE